MKKLYFYPFLFISYFSFSQVTDLVEPKSWQQNLTLNTVDVINVPFNNLESYLEEDLANKQQSIAKPFRFGAKLPINVSRENSGDVIILENNDIIWRVGFESEGARTINFVINNYKLAPGAEMYVFNEDKSMKIGPYTSKENNIINELTTWPVDGDKVFLELYEPKSVAGESTFNISTLVHGYRTVQNNSLLAKGLNDSGNCNLDVNCPLGDDFELQKKSVVMLVVGGSGFCSGTLVNNTSEDKTPYILTANHCAANNSEATVGGVFSWAFRFNWISPNPSCATTANSTDGPYLQTGNGTIVRASDGESDTLLVEATASNTIDPTWDVVFAGWNKSLTDTPNLATGIHHPNGDIMKICRENDTPTRTNFNFNNFLNRVWLISDATGGWEQGVTEPGSSGSQLLDQNGLLVGVLSGGSAACSGTTDNGGFDIYGRLDHGWPDLRAFLDPRNTNNDTTDHLPNIALSVTDINNNNKFKVYPIPTSNELTVEFLEDFSQRDISIYNLFGQLITTLNLNKQKNKIDVSAYQSGVYFIKINGFNEVVKFVVE